MLDVQQQHKRQGTDKRRKATLGASRNPRKACTRIKEGIANQPKKKGKQRYYFGESGCL